MVAFWKLVTSNFLAQVPYLTVWFAICKFFSICRHRGSHYHEAQEQLWKGLLGGAIMRELKRLGVGGRLYQVAAFAHKDLPQPGLSVTSCVPSASKTSRGSGREGKPTPYPECCWDRGSLAFSLWPLSLRVPAVKWE